MMIAPRHDSILEHFLRPTAAECLRDRIREDDIVQGRCPICGGPITIRCDAQGPFFHCACRARSEASAGRTATNRG